MEVIIAARLSQKKDRQGQTGIESQDEDARDWARDNGHNVVATVADIASGTKAMWERKNLRPWVTDPELMAKYQGIVAAKQDRLSRADWQDEEALRSWAQDNHKTLFVVDKNLIWPPREDPRYQDDDVSAWRRGAEDAHREWTATSRRYTRMHRNLRENNLAGSRAPYGYRLVPAEGTDHKAFTIYEPEARLIREAARRYVDGETLVAICDAMNAQYGLHWTFPTLAKRLRNPAIAGRRGKLRYAPIIPWTEHLQLVARLDSRANRKGMSPSNAYVLTGILFDRAGHPMHGFRSSNRYGQAYQYYRCRNGCEGLMVRMDWADQKLNEIMTRMYGNDPHEVWRITPGKNYFEEIARLRQDRAELDDLSDDYDERHAAITAEIRRLAALPAEPDTGDWVPTDQSVADHWRTLASPPARRDWLREHGWLFVAYKRDGRWHLDPLKGATLADDDRPITDRPAIVAIVQAYARDILGAPTTA